MEEEYKLADGDGNVIDPLTERAFNIFALVNDLFHDYQFVNRTHESFIVLNEDFVVELSGQYVRFWSDRNIILTISSSRITKSRFEFDGDEKEFEIISDVIESLLDTAFTKYDLESKEIDQSTRESITRLARKYRNRT